MDSSPIAWSPLANPRLFRLVSQAGIDQTQRRVMDTLNRLFHDQAVYTDTVQRGFRSLIDSFNAEAKNVEARHVVERDKLVRKITAAKAAASVLAGERDTARAEVALITSQSAGRIKELNATLVSVNQRLAAGQDAAERATAERDQTIATLRADVASLASAKDGLQDLLIGSQQRETELSGNVEVLQVKVATVEAERDAAKSIERELRDFLQGHVGAMRDFGDAAEPYLAVKTASSESASIAVEPATDSTESPSNLFAELERRIKEVSGSEAPAQSRPNSNSSSADLEPDGDRKHHPRRLLGRRRGLDRSRGTSLSFLFSAASAAATTVPPESRENPARRPGRSCRILHSIGWARAHHQGRLVLLSALLPVPHDTRPPVAQTTVFPDRQRRRAKQFHPVEAS